MANLDAAWGFVLSHEDPHREGKVVPDPTLHDPKAVARFGINSDDHPEAVIDGFYTMPTDQALKYAENMFASSYWHFVNGSRIEGQRSANQYVDTAYASGWVGATKIVQRALNSLRPAGRQLKVDGIPGDLTLAAINIEEDDQLVEAIKGFAKIFYELLHSENPNQYTANDLASWLSRLNA